MLKQPKQMQFCFVNFCGWSSMYNFGPHPNAKVKKNKINLTNLQKKSFHDTLHLHSIL